MVTRVLITGCGGFLGSHLADLFAQREGVELYGAVHRSTQYVQHLGGRVQLLTCDFQDREAVARTVEQVRPDIVYHMAAQASPFLSWQDPQTTFNINVLGTIYLLDAVRAVAPGARVVFAGSSAAYGAAASGQRALREETSLVPLNPYGVSKMTGEAMCDVYTRAFGMDILRVRPFSVIGPRKTSDSCSDFARGIVAIEQGTQRALRVGNLDAVRDFTDVGDAVRAMVVIGEQGRAGAVYNICSGKGRSIREMLDALIRLSGMVIPVEMDPARMRPSDEPAVIGDPTALNSLGWRPRAAIDGTLEAILRYWRRVEGPASAGDRKEDIYVSGF